MKTSSRLISTLLITACFSTASLAQNTEKVLVKSFNLQGAQEVKLQLNGPVEVKTWDQDILRVQMTISLGNLSESLLKSLIQAGRYNLRAEMNSGAMQISAPASTKEVRINGTLINEQFSFIVFAPSKVHVEIDTDTSALAAKDNNL
jgi:hypothetical protein